MPSVNVVTAVQSGQIGSSSSFEWHNPNTTGGSCQVTNVGSWCTSDTYSVPQAASASSPGKAPATTLNVTGDFSFTCPCCNTPNARVHIGSRFGGEKPGNGKKKKKR